MSAAQRVSLTLTHSEPAPLAPLFTTARWLVNGVGLIIMSLFGEWLCLRREMQEIPLSEYGSVLGRGPRTGTGRLGVPATLAPALAAPLPAPLQAPLVCWGHCPACAAAPALQHLLPPLGGGISSRIAESASPAVLVCLPPCRGLAGMFSCPLLSSSPTVRLPPPPPPPPFAVSPALPHGLSTPPLPVNAARYCRRRDSCSSGAHPDALAAPRRGDDGGGHGLR